MARPLPPCPSCRRENTRFLSGLSSDAHEDYYRCEGCGHVWITAKGSLVILRDFRTPKPKERARGVPHSFRRSDPVPNTPTAEGFWAEHQRLIHAVLALSDPRNHPVTKHEYRAFFRHTKMLRADIAQHRQDAGSLRPA